MAAALDSQQSATGCSPGQTYARVRLGELPPLGDPPGWVLQLEAEEPHQLLHLHEVLGGSLQRRPHGRGRRAARGQHGPDVIRGRRGEQQSVPVPRQHVGGAHHEGQRQAHQDAHHLDFGDAPQRGREPLPVEALGRGGVPEAEVGLDGSAPAGAVLRHGHGEEPVAALRLAVAPVRAVRQWHADMEAAESACKRRGTGNYSGVRGTQWWRGCDIAIHQFLICGPSFVFIYERRHLERSLLEGKKKESETLVKTGSAAFFSPLI